MQDYFKYDDIQRGSPLFMKSDSDGTSERHKSKLPLGIKSITQGIEHFSNWNELSNSIEANKGVRFEDSQPNSATFQLSNNRGFHDSWKVNDIKICDDIAFVAYEDYTDISKMQISNLVPYSVNSWELRVQSDYYGNRITQYSRFLATMVNLNWERPPNGLAMENAVIRVRLKDGLGSVAQYVYNPFNSDYISEYRDIYFLYGGIRTNESPYRYTYGEIFYDATQGAYNNAFKPFTTNQNLKRKECVFGGYFYLVIQDPNLNYGDVYSPKISLPIMIVPSIPTSDSPAHNRIRNLSVFGVPIGDSTTDAQGFSYIDLSGVMDIEMFKIQPFRQCGKVDIYTKKSGFFTSIVNNSFTSPSHTLDTNDIIKISSALFDGNEAGHVDIHPLNGEKFVKKIDDNTIELYDDQFFEIPSSTNNLKSTNGINWLCVGSSNGNFAQSWKYKNTLYSPTGKNGYQALNSSYEITTNRIKDNIDISILDTSIKYTAINIEHGKTIENILNNIPTYAFIADNTFNGNSFYADGLYGWNDLYPFTYNYYFLYPNPELYTGNRFGCSMDAKFMRYSGDSKIYLVAIGERGSDVSVDFFSTQSEIDTSPNDARFYDSWTIKSSNPSYIPHNLPYGKIHLFHMTIDKYQRITNFEYKRTIYGDGGSSIRNAKNDNTIIPYENPWNKWRRVFNWYDYADVDGAVTTAMVLPKFSSFDPVTNGSRSVAPFYETFDNNTSMYWDRAALVHWFGIKHYDYFSNSTNNSLLSPIEKDYSDRYRSFVQTNGTSTENKSYYGDSGFGSTITPYRRIDRFDINTNFGSQWFIFPWVDSFGKSVAIGDINKDGHIQVFGSASTRSNIALYNPQYVPNGKYDYVFRPVLPSIKNKNSIFPNGYSLTSSQTESQIGQISCILVTTDNSCMPQKLLEINSGGSVDTYNKGNDPSQYITEVGINQTLSKLRTGRNAGVGHNEVISSCHLSAKKIIYKDGMLIWADQVLSQGQSIINILKYNFNNDSFTPFSNIVSNFTTPRLSDASFVGDGFGTDIKYDDGILITNGMTTKNNFNDDIGTLLGFATNSFRVDCLKVFELNKSTGAATFIQNIFPAFDKLDVDQYSELIPIQYSDNLLDIDSITYDNDTHGSSTWNIRLVGRYDTFKNKILLKDPIEYTIFAPDYSVNKNRLNTISTNSVNLTPYLYFTENFRNDSVYYDYSTKSQFIIENRSSWNVIDSSRIGNTANSNRTPVFFINVPSSAIDLYRDLSITLNLDTNTINNISSINLDTFNIISQSSSIIPKLVLYKTDPRSTIIPNGPSSDGSNTDLVNFTNGIFDTLKTTINKTVPNYNIKEIYPPLFRGGASDLFHYSNLAGSTPELTPKENFISSTLEENKDFLRKYFGGSITLGQLFDQTFTGNKGLISWFSPDVHKYTSTPSLINRVPYAQINFSGNFISSSITFNLPYNTWKDFLIRGSLIKNQKDNRPLFNNFTRIKHGQMTNESPFSGNWDYEFNDVNRPSYSPTIIDSINISPYYTLAIGFVIDDIADQDVANSTQPNYQYSNVSSSSYVASNNLTIMNDILSYNRLIKINNIDINAQKTSLSNIRYKTKFHKVAFFKYNNEIYDDIQKHLFTESNQSTKKSIINRQGFGKYDFVPFVASTTNAPVVAMGHSLSNSFVNGINNESFAKSIQILTSDNLYSTNNVVSNLYLNNSEDKIYTTLLPTGLLNNALFEQQSLLGGFDVLNPDYLSLSIIAAEVDNGNIPLYIKYQQSSGNIPLYVNGFTSKNANMPLKIGQKISSSQFSLLVRSPSINFTSLYINEKPPSGIIPIYVGGPDIDNSLTLAFQPPATGNIPLNIFGPTQLTSGNNLNIVGKTLFLAQNTLFVDCIGISTNILSLDIDGVFNTNNNISLAMNKPTSGNTTLHTYGVFPVNEETTLSIKAKGSENLSSALFIGTQFEVTNKNTTLAIKDTERRIDKFNTVYIEGNINYANTLKNGETNFTLQRLNQPIDISENSEIPISLTFNNKTTSTNSLTYRNLIGSQYQKTDTSNVKYFGSQIKNIKNKNPAYITRLLDVSKNNKSNAFYADESNNLLLKNNIIKRQALDSNHYHLIAGHTDNKFIALDIYNIFENEFLSFEYKLFIGLNAKIPDTPNSQDILYAQNGSVDYPFGDSFIGLKRAIKQYFLPSFTNVQLVNTDVVINDIKLSQSGKCAISLRGKFNYLSPENNQTKIFNIIILFDISNIKEGRSSIGQYSGQKTYYISEYDYYILEESGQLQDKHSSGYNIAFSDEDLYFDRRSGQWGQIWKLSKSSNYRIATQIIDFGTHPDIDGYINPNNIIYIPENTKKDGFGVPLKIYDDHYGGNGSKIMFIGAQLFDPYVFNTLDRPHIPNAIGAVYIYKKPSNSSSWNYFGALYGKGNTSLNVISNLTDYKASTIDNQEYGLFGYDFDYNGGNIIVCEPGGDGEDEINGGKAYLFKINNSITLIKEYSYADINTFTGTPISIEDDFVSSVVLLNPDNPITYSSRGDNNSIIHSLHNNTAFVNDLSYVQSQYTTANQAKNNLNNENKYYDSNFIASFNNNLVDRFSTIVSMKKLNFGNNNFKLGIIREFYSRIASYNQEQYLNKLKIIDVNNEPHTLYISGPNIKDQSLLLSVDTFDVSTNSTSLYVNSSDISNSGLNMMIYNNMSSEGMSLHMENLYNNYIGFSVDGTFVPTNGSTLLHISPAPEARLGLAMRGIGYTSLDTYCIIYGNINKDFKKTGTLFIGQDIDHNDFMSTYIVGGGSYGILLGYTLDQDTISVAISGRAANINSDYDQAELYIAGPDFDIVNSGAALYITTEIPPTGDSGLYLINSGVTAVIGGNNDAQIFTDKSDTATLSIVSTINVTGIAPLYIERPYGALMGLFIKDQNPTGVFTTIISGAYIGSGDLSLSISPPTANTVDMIVRGFLE